MIKAVIFDLDDTLLMTRETKYAAHKFFGKKQYNMDLSDEDITLHWGKPLTSLMTSLYGNHDTIDNILRDYNSIRDNFPNKPYPGSLDTITLLSQKVAVGILSSSTRPFLISSLIEAGIRPELFFYIQSEEDTTFHKPNPRVFDPLLKKLAKRDIYPSEAVYIGDSVNDCFAARGAGLDFYGVSDRTTPQIEFDVIRAKTISSLSKLTELL